MFSCYYQPTLTEPDLFSSGPLNFLLLPDIIIAAKQKVFIKKYAIVVFILLFSVITGFAQRRIAGVVTTPDGLQLSGVTIIIKGTKLGTAANGDGSFVIYGLV